jgi:outer membrane protein
MRPLHLVLAAALIGGFAPTAALANDELRGGYSAFVHYGASFVKQADEATLFAGGLPIRGADFTTEGDVTLSIEAGVFLKGGWSIAASGTIPTTISNIASGSLTGLGNLGDETVGYYSLTSQYHFNMRGPISPYFGGGLGYMYVADTVDGVVSNLSVESAWGPVFQAGMDLHFNERLGVFVDVKRYWISTAASGTLGVFPITADATVNPWVFSSGLGVRF